MLKSMASKKLVKDPFRSHLSRNHRVNQNYSINISIAITNQSIFQLFILRIFRKITSVQLFILGIHVDFRTANLGNVKV